MHDREAENYTVEKCRSSRVCTRSNEGLYAFCACLQYMHRRCTAERLELPEEHGSEEASVNGGLVHHDRVLLVVATVACNGHNGIVPRRQLPAHQLCTLNILALPPCLVMEEDTGPRERKWCIIDHSQPLKHSSESQQSLPQTT